MKAVVENDTERTKQDRVKGGALFAQKKGGRALVKGALQHEQQRQAGGEEAKERRKNMQVFFAACDLCKATKSDRTWEVVRDWATTHKLMHKFLPRHENAEEEVIQC